MCDGVPCTYEAADLRVIKFFDQDAIDSCYAFENGEYDVRAHRLAQETRIKHADRNHHLHFE
jgi:hypothetical protein